MKHLTTLAAITIVLPMIAIALLLALTTFLNDGASVFITCITSPVLFMWLMHKKERR